MIHVGNSSQISDESGAPSDKGRELVLTAIARVHTAVLTANDPVVMLTAPIPATARP